MRLVKSYYAVRYGGHVRISAKVMSNRAACMDCYGTVDEGMEVKNLGSVVSRLRSDKWRLAQLKSHTGWIIMKGW